MAIVIRNSQEMVELARAFLKNDVAKGHRAELTRANLQRSAEAFVRKQLIPRTPRRARGHYRVIPIALSGGSKSTQVGIQIVNNHPLFSIFLTGTGPRDLTNPGKPPYEIRPRNRKVLKFSGNFNPTALWRRPGGRLQGSISETGSGTFVETTNIDRSRRGRTRVTVFGGRSKSFRENTDGSMFARYVLRHPGRLPHMPLYNFLTDPGTYEDLSTTTANDFQRAVLAAMSQTASTRGPHTVTIPHRFAGEPYIGRGGRGAWPISIDMTIHLRGSLSIRRG